MEHSWNINPSTHLHHHPTSPFSLHVLHSGFQPTWLIQALLLELQRPDPPDGGNKSHTRGSEAFQLTLPNTLLFSIPKPTQVLSQPIIIQLSDQKKFSSFLDYIQLCLGLTPVSVLKITSLNTQETTTSARDQTGDVYKQGSCHNHCTNSLNPEILMLTFLSLSIFS